MSGLLSQAVANLTAAEQHIAGVGGLPPQAQQMQTESSDLIAPAVQQIGVMQQAVAAFAQSSTTALNQVQGMVSQGASQQVIQAEIAQVQGGASQLQSIVNEVNATLASTSSSMAGFFNQLATVEWGLSAQISQLQGQLNDAQSEEEVTRKRYYYLLALGPLGLIGLATALGLYEHWQQQVNDYESQAASLNAQINAFNAMKASCQGLGTGFAAVVDKATAVKNTVSFVADDVLAVGSDLQSGTPPAMLGIVVATALTEIGTLASDAS